MMMIPHQIKTYRAKRRPGIEPLIGVLRAGLASLPLAVGFGCWLSLHWHAPTETLAGLPSGDLIYYSTAIVSLAKQIYPYLNLGYEREALNLYFNLLFSLTGAALSNVIEIDPFLFIAAAGSVFFVLSAAVSIHAYVSGLDLRRGGWSLSLSFLVLSVVVANRYPYWIIESIPMIYVMPITLSVVYFARQNDVRGGVISFAAAIVGSALSKVAAATVLASFAGATMVKQYFMMSRTLRIVASVSGVVGALYAGVLLHRLGPLNFSVTPFGPVSLDLMRNHHHSAWTVLPLLLRDVAACLLIIVAFLLADWFAACAIAVGFALFLIYPFLFQIDFVCAALILGLIALDRSDRLRQHRILAFGALLLAVPAAILTDPAGVPSGLVWLVCVGGTAWVAIGASQKSLNPERIKVAVTATLVIGFGLVAVARGYLKIDYGLTQRPLTVQARDIWGAVKDRTPADALIFTDQVGMDATLLGGWNLYAFIGARQIFVSNLYMNPATRMNRQLSLAVLEENDAVLSGKVPPSRVTLRGQYSSYYAVVSRTRVTPASWKVTYENEHYRLFELPTR